MINLPYIIISFVSVCILSRDRYVHCEGNKWSTAALGNNPVNVENQEADKFVNDLKLVQLNILFRHGDRTVDKYPAAFPNDPYMHDNSSSEIAHNSMLTDEGKERMFRYGRYLRNRYSEFVGRTYDSKYVYGISSITSRTRTSLQLVLAGLYENEPNEDWDTYINKHKKPLKHLEFEDDMLFFPMFCPSILAEYERVRKSPEVEQHMSQWQPYISELKKAVGFPNKMTCQDVLILYQNLLIENQMNLPLAQWAKDTLANNLTKTVAFYDIQLRNFNTRLRRNNGGPLILEFIKNMVAERDGKNRNGQKIFLYSGHDVNVAGVQSALGVFVPHLPDFSSSLIFELWTSNNQYFVKVYYYLGRPAEIREVILPGCKTLCPIDDFLNLTRNVIPSDEELSCKKGLAAALADDSKLSGKHTN